jgi:hypothetical protein
MKRLFWPVAIACVLLSPPAGAGGGDVNGDGRIDEADAELIAAYLQGRVQLQDAQIAAADADGDGRITPRDRDLLRDRLRAQARGGDDRGRIDWSDTDGGVVVDKQTGEPLAGVEVALPDEGFAVRTDAQGRFRLPRGRQGKILSARAERYAPTATTTGHPGGYRLELQRLTPRLQVLDDGTHHLGDDKYGWGSANREDFRLHAQGPSYTRTFDLEGKPGGDLVLRVGSLIGLDTAEAVALGQSQLTQFLGARPDGLRVVLNGRLVGRFAVNGDNLAVALPASLLRVGRNEVRLETYPLQLPASLASDALNEALVRSGIVNYDDIEFAHLILERPERPRRVGAEIYRPQRMP